MKRTFILVSILISYLIGNSQPAKNGLFDQSSVKVSEIRSNTIRSDFGPAVIGDSIYFSSFRDEVIDKSDKELKEKEFYDLYKAAIDVYGNVVSDRQPLEEFITRFHDGPVSWCAKTGELFVTQSNYVHPLVKYQPFRSEEIKLRIVVAKKIKDKWIVVEEFPFNNPAYSVGHPAISTSGDTLVFTSDMPGGFGSTDLYLSTRKNGKWSTPVNMGSQVNTSGKDEFPFLTGNSFQPRFLVFASTGHNSMGGFDLFYKKLNDSNGEVFQFPTPINSTSDDFAMTLPEHVEYGYMTSNRSGTGSDDIYKITFDKDIDYLQEVVVVNSKTRKPIPGAMVNFCDKKSGMTGIDGMISQLFKKNSECNTTVSALGYKDNKFTISIGTPRAGVILRDTIPLDMIVNEKIVLKNIYYDFDRWDILPESAIELDRLVSFTKENPEIKVELGSHTDARGSQQYNLRLSELRAQAAVNYIVSKGIDKSNVKGIGYGESQLINICTSAQPCTSAQQRENRRTELYIPGFLSSIPVKQEFGDYSDGKSDHGRNYSSYKQHGSIYSTTASGTGTDAGAYYLILGSFKDTINAGKFVQQLKVDGFEATVLTESEPVRVGNKYQFYGQAKRALDTLKSKSYIGWIIQGN
ncbi:MAG TPA: OmpA family protein [Prolixibacteraceae bacterium]|nr:OmpA family protein [Prolixibacteraceae bacterium]